MSKTVRIVLIIGVILVALMALTFHSRRSPVGALAAYKAELRAKGEKLSAEELGFPRPPESSGNLNLLLAGVSQLGSAQIDPGRLELMHFVSAGRVEVAWAQPQLAMSSIPLANSNAAAWDIFCAQFESAADALQDIRVAVQIPPRYFFNDPTNFLNQPKPPFVQLRIAAQWFMGDAIAALHASQLDRAREDIHALAQLAQFHRDDLTLVSQMMRVATAGLGLATTWEALQADGWSEQNLASMQKDWEAVDLATVFEKAIVGERAFGGAYFNYLRDLNPRQRVAAMRFGNPSGRRSAEDFFNELVVMPLWRANSESDEAFYLRHLQISLDAFRQLQKGTPWPEVSQQIKTNLDGFEVIISNPITRYRHLVSGIVLPNYIRAGSTCIRNETQRQLTITAIALARCHLRDGKFPAELDALVPQFLSAVPIDPMSAKALRYRPNGDGSFTLYSVGEDGRDDGGDPTTGSATNKFGLWEAKDAVWPRAAK
jgi:hypothetical protein